MAFSPAGYAPRQITWNFAPSCFHSAYRTQNYRAPRKRAFFNLLILLIIYGEPCWIRTSDLLIKSQLLYRLS